jgi:hypothetical protein
MLRKFLWMDILLRVACTLLRWVGVRIYILHKMRGAGIGIGLRYW